MLDKTEPSALSRKQETSRPIHSTVGLNKDFRKNGSSDIDDSSRASKRARFTTEHSASHHRIKRKSSGDMVDTLPVLKSYSTRSATTVCSMTTINSQNQFTVSLKQKVRSMIRYLNK
jgi:hypothetical protein